MTRRYNDCFQVELAAPGRTYDHATVIMSPFGPDKADGPRYKMLQRDFASLEEAVEWSVLKMRILQNERLGLVKS